MKKPASDSLEKRSSGRRTLILFFIPVGLIAYCGFNYFGLGFSGFKKGQAESFSPSKETTYYMAPLDEEGYVDLSTAFYAEWEKKIPIEENAAYRIIGAFGGRGVDGSTLGPICQYLNIEPIDKQSPTYQDYYLYLKESGEWTPENDESLTNELSESMERPWSSEQYPHVHQWLLKNREPLEEIKQASLLSAYFVRRNLDDELLLDVNFQDVMQIRSAARALQARAMQRCERSQFDEAWGDIQAIHRIARLLSDCPFLLERLTGFALENMAAFADAQWLNSLPASYQGLSDKLKQIEQLRPLADYSAGLKLERVAAIQAILQSMRGKLDPRELPLAGDQLQDSPFHDGFDPQSVLKEVNHYYDELIAIQNLATYSERVTASEEFDRQLVAASEEAKAIPGKLITHARWALIPNARSKDASEIIATLFASVLVPSAENLIYVNPQADSIMEVVKTAFVLTDFRLNHQRLPRSLEEAGLPNEKFSVVDRYEGKPFRFVPDGPDHVWIYHLGPDGKDNSSPTEDHELAGMDYGFRLGPN